MPDFWPMAAMPKGQAIITAAAGKKLFRKSQWWFGRNEGKWICTMLLRGRSGGGELCCRVCGGFELSHGEHGDEVQRGSCSRLR